MRALIFCLPLLPVSALADTVSLPSKATSVIVYSQGATVTHDVTVSLPAGAHQLIFPDLPANTDLETLRVAAPGLKLGAIRYRQDAAPPRDADDTPEIAAAKARIDAIEDQIQQVEDRAARQQLAVEAAEAQIDFLSGLANSETLPTETDTLRALAQMISAETLSARQAAFDAELAVRETQSALKDLTKDLQKARQALAALVPASNERAFIVMDVVSEAEVTNAPIALSFFANAYWQPTYDLRLSDGPNPQLVVERGAEVVQQTDENWDGVQLSVSTRAPNSQTDPNELYPDLRRIVDESKLRATSRVAPEPMFFARTEADAAESAVVAESAAGASFEGLSVTYTYANPVDVAAGADAVRLPFDNLTFDVELIARAVPLLHDTAFLVAKITNTSGEPLLATDQVLRFFDGVLVGGAYLPAIEAGAEAEIGFGTIDGLQLTRRILKRDSGDRGIITRSNEQTEETEITLKNLTNRTWNVELRDRVPYSEQDDLEVTYRTSPDPDVTAVDDKRGVLQWNIEMPPGNEGTVSLSHRITWPEGQQLR